MCGAGGGALVVGGAVLGRVDAVGGGADGVMVFGNMATGDGERWSLDMGGGLGGG